MKFTHYERMWMNNILPMLIPEQSTRYFYQAWDKFIKAVGFSEKELKHLEMKFPGEKYLDEKKKKQTVPEGKMIWNPKRHIDKDIVIPEVIMGMMVRKFQELDKKGKLPREAIPVFDRFIDESGWFKEEEKQEKGK